MQAYLSNNALVLTENAQYQPVDKLIPGQTVLNMKLEPVKVLTIGECLKTAMVQVNYQNWYEPLRCSATQEILVIDKIQNEDDTCELKWVTAEKLTPGMMLMSAEEIYDKLPESFTVLSGVVADYTIGLLFGLYAGYGHIVDEKIEFTFGPNDELMSRIKELILQVCGSAQIELVQNDSVYQLLVRSQELVALFSDFGNKVERRIPRQYWIRNKNYLQGLFEGLIDYNPELKLCRYISVSREMCEAFVWITSQQAINFGHDSVQTHENLRIYPLLVRVDQEQSYLNRVVSVSPTSEEKGWCISLNCETNSMVVNNIIVKCDDDED